ncbi:FAD-dependent thymidylate synthase [bacterium]|nr:FAD-dependent thymidylate synthase [bacterium]
MAHIIVPQAEALLDKEFKVLDKGFVRLVDYLGGDDRIVQAARVSYAGGTKTVREDKALIDYLISHEHTSPFEQVVLTFHCKMPVFVARQWIRHRTARLNEISGRYSVMVDEFYNPEKEQVLYQSKSNRQGRDTEEVPEHLKGKVLDILINGQNSAYDDYQKLINEGIARELSRINLPLSLYTQWYWQIDLSNLFHFLKLRMDYHAQWEIRQYAGIMADITKAVAPMAYEAFETHVLNSVSFSGQELEALKLQIEGKDHNLSGIHKAEYEAKIKNIQL